MIHVEKRASTVLYKFLVSNCKDYRFLIPANVCTVVPLTFLKAGIGFSFVDIDLKTHAGSFVNYMEFVHNHKDEKLGVLFVNAYGARQETKQFYRDLRLLNKNLIVVEDNCLCVPETQRIEPIDDVDLELYSTGYSKIVQLPIGGGYGLISKRLLYRDCIEEFNINGYSEQMKVLTSCYINGALFKYVENWWLPTLKLDLDDMSVDGYISLVDSIKDSSLKYKRKINKIYDSIIDNNLKIGSDYNEWRYNLIFPSKESRNAALDAIFKENLFASPHYKSAAFIFKGQFCINAEREAGCILNLFNEEKYSEQMAERTATIINEIYRQYDK